MMSDRKGVTPTTQPQRRGCSSCVVSQDSVAPTGGATSERLPVSHARRWLVEGGWLEVAECVVTGKSRRRVDTSPYHGTELGVVRERSVGCVCCA